MNLITKLINIFNINFRPDKILLSKPKADKETYMNIFEEAKILRIDSLENFLRKNNCFIDNNWFDKLALHTQVVIKKSKVNYYHGKLLYVILNDYIMRNHLDELTILETGTARGFSSICMSKALNETNQRGKIYTIDILPNEKKMYWNCIDDHEGKKTRLELLSQWQKELKNIKFYTGKSKKILKKLKFERINFAFLDAAHNFKDLMAEYEFVSMLQKKGDVIFFDDYSPNIFNQVVKAVKEIESKKNYNIEKIYGSNERSYAVAYKL